MKVGDIRKVNEKLNDLYPRELKMNLKAIGCKVRIHSIEDQVHVIFLQGAYKGKEGILTAETLSPVRISKECPIEKGNKCEICQ